ncbi:carbon starvation CstA family protein [Sinimarinibacterium sp. NLF-5-8]|uniref:carbon starvation CstA family protein n=1 Tax=Sinimarinibacterium sp. NLF-5-8 TaxID=2698684 RepID=UPI00137BA128|nr:carbon starvation protein A [Sinimarinibacterium sp. NLF-5-8]
MAAWIRQIGWGAVAVLGACALAVVSLSRGDSVNALWVITAALSVYVIGYRYYSLFLAQRVLRLDPQRMPPAHRHNDGLDFVPTHKGVLFGHHFAAIAGAGPLVGPVLAAQLGYLPGLLWLLIGVVLAGAVQDMTVLLLSTRRDGRSLGEMIKAEMGVIPGVIAMIGSFIIMTILLAVLALIVVKALVHSPWGSFTVFATLPIALLMGVYLRFIRPGRVGEVSLIGLVLLIAAIIYGGHVARDPQLAGWFTLEAMPLAWILIGYGFVAAVLPVWLVLAPRDYLSTFLKIGTILGLAVGIVLTAPDLKMPATTRFLDGTGPVWTGSVFPFLFITIACGAVSGFHALIASGTTPKMIDNERDIRFIGYGGMLMESFVAVMALVAASIIEPGLYFAMNSPAALIGDSAQSAARIISEWGFVITPEQLSQTAAHVGEHSLLSRTGGAPTLAVGMAHILTDAFGGMGGQTMMAFWYHFAILFEALFILTALDAGTRAGRFMLQDLIGAFIPVFRQTHAPLPTLIATALCVAAWGYFLIQGVVDPLGGVNTLWPLFGVANQMLAAIALILASVVLLRMKRQQYLWVTAAPTAWLLVCTLSGGWQKIFSADFRIGFLAQAQRFAEASARGELIAPAQTLAQMQQIALNNRIDAALTALLMLVVVSVTVYGVRIGWQAFKNPHPSPHESAYVAIEGAPHG